MIIPVRCFSCGKVVGQQYEEFKAKVAQGEKPEKVLDDLGITRYCCRRTIFAQADLIGDILKYNV